MMTKNLSHEREQLEMLTIDQLVPKDHLLRKIEGIDNINQIQLFVQNVRFYHSVRKVKTIKS